MASPRAVLFDVGGIFLLPRAERIVGAFTRAELRAPVDRLTEAHYRAAAAFSTTLDLEADWSGAWARYLADYAAACGVGPGDAEELHRHLDSEFADAALWLELVPESVVGCVTSRPRAWRSAWCPTPTA